MTVPTLVSILIEHRPPLAAFCWSLVAEVTGKGLKCPCPSQHFLVLKGTGSRDIIQFSFFLKFLVLDRNKHLHWFLDSKMFLWWVVAFSVFPAVSVKTYWRNNSTYWRLLQNHCVTLSNSVLKCSQLHSYRFLWKGKTCSRAHKNFFISLWPSSRLSPS